MRRAEGGRTEPEREVLVGSSRLHRHRDCVPVDSDLERLFDRQPVGFVASGRQSQPDVAADA
jgi:hypothetical protein